MTDIVKGVRRIAEEGYRFAGDAADEIERLRANLEAAEAECLEQSRLNGMGASREAALITKLEAAEKELAELRSSMKFRTSLLGRTEAERDALRAKIEAMEKQEPARLVTAVAYRWRYRGAVMWQYGELTEETARLAKEHNHEVQALGILPGAQTQPAPSVPSEQDESVRKAWSRFSNELHRSPDAPYPGMSEAFEQHFSQSFIDREWRSEAATWAAAWKAAKRHCAQPAPSVPEVTDAMAIAFHAALTDGGIGLQEVEEIKTGLRAALAAAPEAKP